MSKYICLFLVLLFSSKASLLVSQNKIKWVTWEEAMEKSKKEKKKIFIDVYTDWCGWCKKMDKSTFSEDDIAKYLNTNYYSIKFDAEMSNSVIIKGQEFKLVKNGNRGTHELAVQLLNGQMSYPSTVFLDEDYNIIQAIPGFQDAKTFEMIITYFGSNSHKSIPWQKYMQNFERGTFFNTFVKDRN